MTEKELFNKCISVILKNEGGYVNNPNDPGGETKYGIAKRYNPNVDIKNLTEDQAKDIYYVKYWKPMKLFGINNPEIVLQIFDMGVNAGTKTAVKLAQEIINVTADGICGGMTIQAINSYTDFISAYKESRIAYYEKRKNAKYFLKGWINRVNNTHF